MIDLRFLARPRAALLLTAALTLGVAAAAQPPAGPCPPATLAQLPAAWTLLRENRVTAARDAFARILAVCPAVSDARTGLGYAALRLDAPLEARKAFTAAIAGDSASVDAWLGLALAARRTDDLATARMAVRAAARRDRTRDDVRTLLAELDPDFGRAPLNRVERPAELQLISRTAGARFEVRTRAGWKPLLVRGVNFGVALPGRFPAEFPTDSLQYAEWIALTGRMQANVIRLYTILPPPFYRALRAYNEAHPDAPVWLVHGVWTELPPKDDFDDAAWQGAFIEEMHAVVDLLHGAAELPVRPGHASGRYDADVSRWTLAYILGREWEPYAVRAYDSAHAARPVAGRFLQSNGPIPAMDAWMAEQSERLLAYEFDTYHALRPIAYTNWPTLDPLHHPTEANTAEERAWRIRRGQPFATDRLEYENDAIALDANLIRATDANPAGWFASYHAYPYYPDFMGLDSAYGATMTPEGPSHYAGYLQDLVRHHAGMPVLISEWGVPSSRGMAHWQPEGWSHGGHDQLAQARITARMARDIERSGTAGGIVFALLDEWFKRNWLVIDFQLPAEHVPRWVNVMDAEQQYGLLALLPGDAATRPVPGGALAPWQSLPHPASADSALRAGADEGWFYVSVAVPALRGVAAPWDSLAFSIGIDTWSDALGQHRLPEAGIASDVGFEFVAELRAPTAAALRAAPGYRRHALPDPRTGDDAGRFFDRPIAPKPRNDGRLDSLLVVTNRARFGRDGTYFPARTWNRGTLRFGRHSETTLSDWFWDAEAGVLQLRLPWDLLNVTDPSTRTILFDPRGRGELPTVVTPGLRIAAALWRTADRSVVSTWPSATAGRWRAADLPAYAWTPWSVPRWHVQRKPVYDSLRDLWTR